MAESREFLPILLKVTQNRARLLVQNRNFILFFPENNVEQCDSEARFFVEIVDDVVCGFVSLENWAVSSIGIS